MNRRLLITMLMGLCSFTALGQQLLFKNTDRVCFIGNSITMQGGFHHNIALFYATRFPKANVAIYNCGISGNQTINVIARMDSDILIHKPTWSVVKLGMNDVHRELYSKDSVNVPGIEAKKQHALDVYRNNYEIIIETLLKNKSKVILQTPTIYEETTAMPGEIFPGRNGALKKCAGYVEEFGRKYHLPVVDYWYAMQNIDKRIQRNDPSATIIGKDREHPGDVGHLIMAYQFLVAAKLQPMVSEMMIDAREKKAISTFNSTIYNVRADAKSISFTALENSLPFPVSNEQRPALKLVPFNDLNKEILKISWIPQGKYRLTIDNEIIGVFLSDSIRKGIDLALYENTPQYKQSKKVLDLFRESWQLEGDVRWMKAYQIGRLKARKIYSIAATEKYFNEQLQKITDTTTVAYKNLIAERDKYLPVAKREKQMLDRMERLHQQIYVVNKPVAHRFEVIKTDQ